MYILIILLILISLLFIKVENNIKYYVEFHMSKNKSHFIWVQESISKAQDLINKLVYISIDKKLDLEKFNPSKIININPVDKIFKLQYSFLNKYIRNLNGECSVEQIYYTIHNKHFNTIIPQNKHNYLYNYFKVNLFYDNNSRNITLKTNIKNDITLSYFKLNNLNTKEYVLYNSFKNIIIKYNIKQIGDASVISFNYDNVASYDEIFKKIKESNIFNLKMNKEILENGQNYLSFEIKVENKSFLNNTLLINAKCAPEEEEFKSCDENEFLLYIKDGSGLIVNMFDFLYPGNSNNINNKTFTVITHNPVNSKLAINNILDEEYQDPLFLKPVSQYSPYYFLLNSDGNYLYADKTNIYVSDKTLPIISIKKTNNISSIDDNYLFYIKPNILGIVPNNNNHTKCLQGGKLKGGSLIGNSNLKLDDYINDILIEERNSNTRKYNLCYNNTIVNFYNFNLLNISTFSKILKEHYSRNTCYVSDTINHFKYNLLDNNNIYSSAALVSHQNSKDKISSLQHLFNLLNYSKVNNSQDTLEIPSINKKIQFLNYVDNKSLWNDNSDNISLENTNLNLDKYFIDDPVNLNKYYKVEMYRQTNSGLSQYKNNISGLYLYTNGIRGEFINVNDNRLRILELLTVDSIKYASVFIDIEINSNNISIKPYCIKPNNIFKRLTPAENKLFDSSQYNINTESKFSYSDNANSDHIQIRNKTLYLPIGRTYRLDQTNESNPKNNLVLSKDNIKTYIYPNEVDYFIDNNRLLDTSDYKFAEGNINRYIIFNPKHEGVYYLKSSNNDIDTITIYTYYDNKHSYNINDYFSIIVNIYNLCRNAELMENIYISDFRAIKVDYNWLNRDPSDLIKKAGNYYIFNNNPKEDDVKNNLIYPENDDGTYDQRIAQLRFPNNNIYKLINNNSFYETQGYKLTNPDEDSTIDKTNKFSNFPYSNNYIDLLNMEKNEATNLNGYVLSSGYYFCVNYHFNNSTKPPSNYILFTNSKLYMYDSLRDNKDFNNTKLYKTCKNFKINVEYINNINTIFYYGCTDSNNNIEDIKKPELNDMSSNSLYPIYYNDTRNKVNQEYDKYARINNDYMNTIIIPGYKKNKTNKTIEFPLIELNYKKNQKFFNTDVLYNIIPYNTKHYIISKNNNNKKQYIRLEYNDGKLINEFNNIVTELYKNYIYIY